MNTILLTENHELIPSVVHCIMQRSNLIDNIQFLVPKIYEDYDMSEFDCVLEYLLPVSKEYHTVFLTLNDDNFKGTHLQYILKAETDITSEAGEIELQLSFVNVELSADSKENIQLIRKTQPCTLTITPISAWSDIIPDKALTSLDQKIVELKAATKALNSLNQEIYDNQVDTLILDGNKLSVGIKNTGEKRGDEITIAIPSKSDSLDGVEDGILDLEKIDINGDGENNNTNPSLPDDTGGGFIEL